MSRVLVQSETRVWNWGEPVDALCRVIERNGVLAVPTESSYAFAADPASLEAIGLIRRIKGRLGSGSGSKPLPVVAGDSSQLEDLGVKMEGAACLRLMREWPAALSLVLPCPPLPAAAGSDRLAVRIPAHSGLRRLLRALGMALTATSANRSNEAPILEPDSLLSLLDGYDAAIVDGGTLGGGPPSTLLRVNGSQVEVLRSGRWPVERLDEVLAARTSPAPEGES